MDDISKNNDEPNEILGLLSKLRMNKDDEVLSYINSHKSIDYNVQDDNGIYFIMYVVASNKPNILKKLLTTTIKLDSLDADGKSIMYAPIKYGFVDVVKILLEHDEKIIGIPLKHITDLDGNTALHYSLIFRNLECLKLLLPDSKCSLQDKNKKNALHYAVGTRQLEMVNLVLQYTTDINCQDKSGETPLHIACRLSLYEITSLLLKYGANPNIIEYERCSTPLQYACYNGHEEIVKILLDNGSDINTIDFQGLTPLHTCAFYDKINIAQLLLNYHPKNIQMSLNINIVSVYHEIPLHILFLKKQTNFIDFVKLLLPKSNINIEDYNGNTCFHFICKSGLWKKFKDTLVMKKLNAVAVNRKNEKPITYILPENKQEFIDMVIDSYVNTLTLTDKKWLNKWESNCSKNITNCRDMAKKHVLDLLEKKSIGCADRTYPVKSLTKCFQLPENSNVSISTFTGFNIDVLSGLVYIAKKYNNALVAMSFTRWDETICKNSQISCHFISNLITWDYSRHELFVADQIPITIKNALNNAHIKYIVMDIFVLFPVGGHSNILLYNKDTYELERFEPHGGLYGKELLDDKIVKYFSKQLPNMKYIAPYQYMKLGLQMFDTNEKSYNTNIGDPVGFCLAWSFWYVDMRIQFPSIKRDKLIKYVITQVNDKHLRYRSIIRNYTINITKLRDHVLTKSKSDINMYLNNNITEEQEKNILINYKKLLPDIYQ